MAAKKILTIPNPILYQVSKEVTQFNRSLRDLVRDMFDSMYAAMGVGLAAVQIGVLQRVVVIDLSESEEAEPKFKGILINPQVIKKANQNQEGNEGCLSVPGLSLPLERPAWVKISYQNLNGQKQELKAEGLFARAILHEMDHLDGKVFIDLLEPHIRQEADIDIKLIKEGKLPRHLANAK